MSAIGHGAIAITLTGGGWSPAIGQADLQAGAGSDLYPTYTSASNVLGISITGTTGGADTWRVDVRRTDTLWDSALTLSVRRTGGGMGSGSVSGGLSYIQVGTTDSTFFSGAGDLTDIPIQMQLGGVSLQTSPDTYSTTLTYTVVDL